MHASTILALSLAPLAALCLPVTLPPFVLANLPQHRPAQHPLIRPNIDNTPPSNAPLTPTTSADPQPMLAAPRPLSTEYLLSLWRHPESSTSRKTSSSSAVAVEQGTGSARGPPTAIAQLETGIVVVQTERLVAGSVSPCRYARVARQQNDALVVCLVLAFFVIVVAVELGGSVCASFGATRGAIRLEDENNGPRAPLSVQAENGEEPAAQEARKDEFLPVEDCADAGEKTEP